MATAVDYYDRVALSQLSKFGYVSPRASLHHPDLVLGDHVYIDDRVLIYRDRAGGGIQLAERVKIHRDSILQTGAGGSISIGARTSIQPRCQLSAYCGSVRIGADTQIAPACAFYPFNHQTRLGTLMRDQPLTSKGGIVIEDDVWLGYGVIVLDGVRIGHGAVIGAGSVVARDIPDGAVAVGAPARVTRMRS